MSLTILAIKAHVCKRLSFVYCVCLLPRKQRTPGNETRQYKQTAGNRYGGWQSLYKSLQEKCVLYRVTALFLIRKSKAFFKRDTIVRKQCGLRSAPTAHRKLGSIQSKPIYMEYLRGFRFAKWVCLKVCSWRRSLLCSNKTLNLQSLDYIKFRKIHTHAWTWYLNIMYMMTKCKYTKI
jgi:hypothetical protein